MEDQSQAFSQNIHGVMEHLQLKLLGCGTKTCEIK